MSTPLVQAPARAAGWRTRLIDLARAAWRRKKIRALLAAAMIALATVSVLVPLRGATHTAIEDRTIIIAPPINLTGDERLTRAITDFHRAIGPRCERMAEALANVFVKIPHADDTELATTLQLNDSGSQIDQPLLEWSLLKGSRDEKPPLFKFDVETTSGDALRRSEDRIEIQFKKEEGAKEPGYLYQGQEVGGKLRAVVTFWDKGNTTFCESTFQESEVIGDKNVNLSEVEDFVAACIVGEAIASRRSDPAYRKAYADLLVVTNQERRNELTIGVERYSSYIQRHQTPSDQSKAALDAAIAHFKKAVAADADKDTSQYQFAKYLLVHALTAKAMPKTRSLSILFGDSLDEVRSELKEHIDTAFAAPPTNAATWTRALALEAAGRSDEANQAWTDIERKLTADVQKIKEPDRAKDANDAATRRTERRRYKAKLRIGKSLLKQEKWADALKVLDDLAAEMSKLVSETKEHKPASEDRLLHAELRMDLSFAYFGIWQSLVASQGETKHTLNLAELGGEVRGISAAAERLAPCEGTAVDPHPIRSLVDGCKADQPEQCKLLRSTLSTRLERAIRAAQEKTTSFIQDARHDAHELRRELCAADDRMEECSGLNAQGNAQEKEAMYRGRTLIITRADLVEATAIYLGILVTCDQWADLWRPRGAAGGDRGPDSKVEGTAMPMAATAGTAATAPTASSAPSAPLDQARRMSLHEAADAVWSFAERAKYASDLGAALAQCAMDRVTHTDSASFTMIDTLVGRGRSWILTPPQAERAREYDSLLQAGVRSAFASDSGSAFAVQLRYIEVWDTFNEYARWRRSMDSDPTSKRIQTLARWMSDGTAVEPDVYVAALFGWAPDPNEKDKLSDALATTRRRQRDLFAKLGRALHWDRERGDGRHMPPDQNEADDIIGCSTGGSSCIAEDAVEAAHRRAGRVTKSKGRSDNARFIKEVVDSASGMQARLVRSADAAIQSLLSGVEMDLQSVTGSDTPAMMAKLAHLRLLLAALPGLPRAQQGSRLRASLRTIFKDQSRSKALMGHIVEDRVEWLRAEGVVLANYPEQAKQDRRPEVLTDRKALETTLSGKQSNMACSIDAFLAYVASHSRYYSLTSVKDSAREDAISAQKAFQRWCGDGDAVAHLEWADILHRVLQSDRPDDESLPSVLRKGNIFKYVYASLIVDQEPAGAIDALRGVDLPEARWIRARAEIHLGSGQQAVLHARHAVSGMAASERGGDVVLLDNAVQETLGEAYMLVAASGGFSGAAEHGSQEDVFAAAASAFEKRGEQNLSIENKLRFASALIEISRYDDALGVLTRARDAERCDKYRLLRAVAHRGRGEVDRAREASRLASKLSFRDVNRSGAQGACRLDETRIATGSKTQWYGALILRERAR